jgi:membrane protein implicated in regulation of membrane protease activity
MYGFTHGIIIPFLSLLSLYLIYRFLLREAAQRGKIRNKRIKKLRNVKTNVMEDK